MWIIVITVSLIACILTAWLCHRYVSRAVASVEAVLERILARDFSSATLLNEDDRISKLAHKANRVTNMLITEAAHAKAEKNTVQGFISDMSHQMKTPLAGIAMYSELLLDGNLNAEDALEFISRMKISVGKLQWMMDSLIKLSHLEVGTISLNPSLEDIGQTISEAIITVLAEAERRRIEISVSNFEDTQLLHDRKWTTEALVNILDNAIKYSANNGKITIAVEPLQYYTKISIADNGIGIPKSDWPQIFKRFYRGQNVKDKEGVGLGLFLVRTIVESQGGYVLVDSNPGGTCGTVFSVFLQNC
ncbi:MAG: HAMP domain-containing histidine kinase [Defluviitaleaceae bacterium]|nr:HAMP domain-containing histidine kinase [Defluviitaleaceae bacterium]